jgi:valyl-tRNA synthetase
MAFQSKYLTGKAPFHDVLIHGIIRDEQGRKVSKSLGNGVDMMDAVDQYGIDALRYFLTTSASPGQDIRYSNEKMEASWNYINKIWNISRYIGINLEKENYKQQPIEIAHLNHIDKWILKRLNQVIDRVDAHYESFKFGEVAKTLYRFIWDDFASWYLEMTKVVFGGNNQTKKINTCAVLQTVLTTILKLLNPFMPFVTDEIYSQLHETYISKDPWPIKNPAYEFRTLSDVRMLFDAITAIRNFRSTNNITQKTAIDLSIQTKDNKTLHFLEKNRPSIEKFCNTESLLITMDPQDTAESSAIVLHRLTLIISMENVIDYAEVIGKLTQEKQKMLEEIARSEKMLQNPSFIQKAPTQKIVDERQKYEQYQQRLTEINQLLNEYTRN